MTNLIGSALNLLCLQSHSKPECRWTGPEVTILGADQKERGLWGRECDVFGLGMRRIQNLDKKVIYVLSLFFFSFSFLFLAAVRIDLLLGLLPVQKSLRKHYRDGQ